MQTFRDGYIYQDGKYFVIEAETNKAVDFLDRIHGWKWRMLDGTKEKEVHITCDKKTVSDLIQELKQAKFHFENFLGAK